MNNAFPVFALAGILSIPVSAQVLLRSGIRYVQNFDFLASASGTNTTVRWTNNLTLPGWYAASQNIGEYSSYRVSGGENSSGWIYSYETNGAHDSNDRAFGSIASAKPGANAFGVRFKNDTSRTIETAMLTCTAEQWRNSRTSGDLQKLEFAYSKAFSPITNPFAGPAEAWTAVSGLDFARLHNGGVAGPLDGNKAANRKQFESVVIPGLKLQPGEELFLRWLDVDDEGQSDHGQAVDDLSVEFHQTSLDP